MAEPIVVEVPSSKGVLESASKIFPAKGKGYEFDFGGKRLTLRLRSMDLESFSEEVEKRIGESGLEREEKRQLLSLLEELMEEVESRSYGLRSGRRVFVGYDRERKVKQRKKKEKRRGKFFYASDFSGEESDFPDEFLDRVVCGDSEEVLRELPDNCVDIVFTSPPYNFGLDYGEAEDGIQWESYFGKLFAVLKECVRVLKTGGRLCINVQPLFSDYIPLHHMVSDFLMNEGLIWKGEILWEKNNYNCKYTAWGSWKSPSSPYLKYTWEFVEVFCKGSLKKGGEKKDADITADEFKDWVYAKWSIAPEGKMKKFGHPAMFPEELARRVLKLFSFRGDVVLDPFNGVGTTTLVAKKEGRRFIGIDVSEEYCKMAEKRLKEVLGQGL